MSTFDVVALGADLSTVLAAALMARRGRRVLLAPGRASPTYFMPGSHQLNPTPEVISSLDRAVVQRVIEELDLAAFFVQRLQDNDPPLQLILPGCRINIDADDELLADQLIRELGLSQAALERALVKAARGSRAVARLIDQRDQWLAGGVGPGWAAERLETEPGSWLHTILRGPTVAVAPVIEAQVGDLAVARTWSSWRRGTSSLTGGLLSLRLELNNIIVAAGGEIMMDADPIGLLQRPDHSVAGVMLEGRPGTIRADCFLLGCDLERLGGLLREGSPLRLGLPRPRIAARRYVVHHIFRRGWIPPSMGRNLLILEGPGAGPGARLDGAFLHVVLDEQSCLASEEVVLSAQALVAPGRSARFDLARVRRTMIDTIRRLIPFFEEGFIHAVSPHDDLGSFTLGPVNRRPPAAAPTRRPWPMAAVFSLDHQQLTREGDSLAGAPGAPLDPGASNLALTHPLVLGSLGIEGDFIVALAAADRLVEEGG